MEKYKRTPLKEQFDFFEKRGFRMKRMELSDMDVAEELCRDVHFEVGNHNLRLYFEMSPEYWYIVLDKDGKAIIIDGHNLMPNGVSYAYILIVRGTVRGTGLTKPLAPNFKETPIMASSTEFTINRLNLHGQHFLEKRQGMFGNCTRKVSGSLTIPTVPGVRLELVTQMNMQKLLEYDRSMILINRDEFTRKWCLPEKKEHGESVLALDEATGRCVGYGTMRLFSDYHGIQPLYADNDEIAVALMNALCKWCLHDDVNLYMPIMSAKRAALKFCVDLDMINTGTEFRNCSPLARDYARTLPVGKMYAVQEYYPV